MLTIEIPRTNAKESAEDKLAKYILNGLEKSKDDSFRFDYYYSGFATGDYGVLSYYKSDIHGKATLEIIKKILSIFTEKGYLVNEHYSSGNIAFVKIQR